MLTKGILALITVCFLGVLFIGYQGTLDYYCRFEHPDKCEHNQRASELWAPRYKELETKLGHKPSYQESEKLWNQAYSETSTRSPSSRP